MAKNIFNTGNQVYPKFYILNFETFVKVSIDRGKIVAENQFGNPFPPAEALEGTPTSQEEFEKARKEAGKAI